MHTLFLILAVGCTFGCGWFTRGAIEDAIQRIEDWRKPARWAVAGAVCAAIIFLFFL